MTAHLVKLDVSDRKAQIPQANVNGSIYSWSVIAGQGEQVNIQWVNIQQVSVSGSVYSRSM